MIRRFVQIRRTPYMAHELAETTIDAMAAEFKTKREEEANDQQTVRSPRAEELRAGLQLVSKTIK
jgi:hypothetical protein